MHPLNKQHLCQVHGGVAKSEGGSTPHFVGEDECSISAFADAFILGYFGGGIGGLQGKNPVGFGRGGIFGLVASSVSQDYQCIKQIGREGIEVYHLASGKGVQPGDPIQP